ncbi:Signal transduction histidine kinase [Desulfuromusa kysingii]|uniref:Sensory/regulatory protein RpfC n=1 Tax=Desulfuromusa kysingii TaxID=37625 RepID=A0A1H3ZW07_9BACT|nr:response regulator [Desulfuromusa kysingii]SEA27838.1 Signal transduction histidine kinase [Desulfuromusa kysingii]
MNIRKLLSPLNKRIILQVFVATLPFLIMGLAVSFKTFDKNFKLIDEISANIRTTINQDIKNLEQQLYHVTEQNNSYMAQLISSDTEKETEAIRDTLKQKAYEIRGAAFFLASSLSERLVQDPSFPPGTTPEQIIARLKQILHQSALKVIYWDGIQPLDQLVPNNTVSADFYHYAKDAQQRFQSDWFEDRLKNKDVVVSLIPFQGKKPATGLFIVFFDLSEAYSYFDRAMRTGLSPAAVKQQEKRFLDAKKQQDQFFQQRALQTQFIHGKVDQRNKTIQQFQNNMVMFTVVNLIALITTAIFLFWYLGTRKITLLNNWLKKTSLAIHKLQDTDLSSGQLEPNFSLDYRFNDHSSNEIGELSRNINFMLETLQETSVSKNSLLREINEKDLIAEELKQSRSAAVQANRMKSEFIANMSHEIRTPLNGVIGMAQLLSELRMTTDQERICQTLQVEADSLLRIINEILDLSKIEAGKMDFELIPFNPRTVIEQVTENLALRIPQKGLEAFSYIPPELPQTLIGDPGRLQQILTNLGNNALKFTSKGQIFIFAEQVQHTKEQTIIKFSVQDTGIGIAAEKRQLIFESFTQADGSTTRKYGGTGLGTTIAKQLVELMGGEIGLNSELGKGSTFWFTIPFNRAPENKSKQPDIDLKGKKVLVIDDNSTSRLILDRYLESYGCEVQLSSDAAVSLAHLSLHSNVDLILTDYNMPDLNGQQFVENLRSSTEQLFKQLPIIMLSSHHTANYLETSQCLEIQGLLRKPVRKDDLRRLLQSVFNLLNESERPKAVNVPLKNSTMKRAGKMILLAEDYPTNQQIALRYLINAGYKVDIAENGQQAVTAVQQRHYDLILMDIQMPEMDGHEATKLIRALESSTGQRTPILAMTAHASTGYRDKCLASAMDDYISKPIRKESFIQKIDQWLFGETDVSADLCVNKRTPQEDFSVFNYGKALQAFLEDQDFLQEVIDGFVANLEHQLPIIEQAIKDEDLTMIWMEAHSIKGGSYNLCATRIAQTAAMLEKAGRHEDLIECKTCFLELKNDVQNFKQYISMNKTSWQREV